MSNSFPIEQAIITKPQTDKAKFVVAPSYMSEGWESETKVVDEAGKPKLMYHGTTTKNFTRFKKPEDLGIHFGTYDQAESRITKYLNEHQKIVSAYLNIRKLIRLPDLENWAPEEVVEEIKKIDPSVFPEGYKMDSRSRLFWGPALDPYYAEIRRFLRKKGYDAIVYQNKVEVVGEREYRMRQNELWDAYQKRASKDINDIIPAQKEYGEKVEALEKARLQALEDTTPTDSYIVFDPSQIKIQSIEPLKSSPTSDSEPKTE